MKNRSKIVKNPSQIDPKSTKNRSWGVLGAQGRFGDASGRARDGFWTPQCRPKADLGAPRASQERPGAVQKRRRGKPEPHQEPPRQLPRRSQRRSRRQTHLEALADRFWIDFRSMRGSSEVRFVCIFTVFFRCRTFCAWIARRVEKHRKNIEKRAFSRPKTTSRGSPSVRKSSSGGQVRAQNAPRAREAFDFFGKQARASHSERERARCEATKSAQALKYPKGPYVHIDRDIYTR